MKAVCKLVAFCCTMFNKVELFGTVFSPYYIHTYTHTQIESKHTSYVCQFNLAGTIGKIALY